MILRPLLLIQLWIQWPKLSYFFFHPQSRHCIFDFIRCSFFFSVILIWSIHLSQYLLLLWLLVVLLGIHLYEFIIMVFCNHLYRVEVSMYPHLKYFDCSNLTYAILITFQVVKHYHLIALSHVSHFSFWQLLAQIL